MNCVTRRRARRGHVRLATACFLAGVSVSVAMPAAAQDAEMMQRLEALEARFQQLETENERLRTQIWVLQAENELRRTQMELLQGEVAIVEPLAMPVSPEGNAPAATSHDTVPGSAVVASAGTPVTEAVDPREMQVAGSENFIGTNPTYAYRILDHAENINSKPLIQLSALQEGELTDRVTLSGSVTAIANYQWTDTDDKFGYLMRHPTSANQLGDHVSEAVLHAASLAFTARVAPRVTAYAEFLYDPQQSFGQGTITALTRNQIQLRRGWVMYGDLDALPVYALVGKMDVPFGLNDTVSPFTNSTNWHAFAGLAYGAQAGFVSGGLHLRGMLIQGGSQFRAANNPVLGTSVPSRANNFALDGRYTVDLGGEGNALMVGASYQHGTAYCQDYPVFHFNPCADNNPGVAAYGRLTYGPVTLLAEYATTTDEWPGTRVPDPTNPLSQFGAVKAESFTLGGRIGFGDEVASSQHRAFALSGEFSKFISGEDGAPWERQNQLVLGASWFAVPNVNLFGEFVHVDGFVPLNFLSGGNFPDGSTWSEQDVDTNVILAGAQVAF